MENNSNNGGFSYTYSAREQAELRKIREKYTGEQKQESKMDRLRRLDNRATQKAQTVSLILGVMGALTLGFGMSLIMSELSDALGLGTVAALIIGIAVGVVGGILTGLAYPIYSLLLKRERAKIAPEILRLTEELMK
jgi:F0F1-type ATP synthase assembly protein I